MTDRFHNFRTAYGVQVTKPSGNCKGGGRSVARPARSHDLTPLNFLLWDSEYKAESGIMYKRSRRCPKNLRYRHSVPRAKKYACTYNAVIWKSDITLILVTANFKSIQCPLLQQMSA
jgi:hypothetical protein